MILRFVGGQLPRGFFLLFSPLSAMPARATAFDSHPISSFRTLQVDGTTAHPYPIPAKRGKAIGLLYQEDRSVWPIFPWTLCRGRGCGHHAIYYMPEPI